MVKDMAEPIEVLKAAMAELQGNMGKVPDETLASSNDRVTQAFQNYDDKVAPLKRAMSMSKKPVPKAKAKNAGKKP